MFQNVTFYYLILSRNLLTPNGYLMGFAQLQYIQNQKMKKK